MKKLLALAGLFFALQAIAQNPKARTVSQPLNSVPSTIPLTPDKWVFQQGKVEFVEYKGVKTLKMLPNSGQVVIKDLLFKDGIIEFDVEPLLPGFAQSVYFHRKDEKEQEIVYLRVGTIGNKLANEGIQYTPYFDGINMWDMYPEYQGPAPTKAGQWNHIKLVISGKQLIVYMNDLPKPVLYVPELEGRMGEGTIAFDGNGYITNVQVKPAAATDKPLTALPDITDHDANYLRNWAVSSPAPLPAGSELGVTQLPAPTAFVDTLYAERRGFINLTRKFGGNAQRKYVWVKTMISAKENVNTKLQLGFSDEVWVFLNNQMVLVDKNLYMQNMRKYPGGRISIQNTSANLNLKKGDNELLIGVANDFYGWGIMARLESMDQVINIDDVSGILKVARELANLDLDPYLGVYGTTKLPLKITLTKKDKTLVAQATGQDPISLVAAGNHVFRFDQFGIVMTFKPAEKKFILRQGGEEVEFVKE